MKSLKKAILALGLTLGIIASIGGGAVFAASEVNGHVNSYATNARSRTFTNSADARTFFGAKGIVTVNSEYTYINVNTLSTGKITKNDGGNNTYVASLGFTAPSNCRSVRIKSSHVVYAYGELWSVSTNA